MAYRDIGTITAAAAEAETDRLFDEPPPTFALELPADLTQRGFKLIIRAPNQMFAVSEAWGCTGTKAMIGAVVREARDLVNFCTAVNRKKQRADT